MREDKAVISYLEDTIEAVEELGKLNDFVAISEISMDLCKDGYLQDILSLIRKQEETIKRQQAEIESRGNC